MLLQEMSVHFVVVSLRAKFLQSRERKRGMKEQHVEVLYLCSIHLTSQFYLF